MNNGDMPAQALSGDTYSDFTHYLNTKGASYNPECQGLTKREEFAMAAMQGLLVNMGRNEFNDVIEVASEAVDAADALLLALEGAK